LHESGAKASTVRRGLAAVKTFCKWADIEHEIESIRAPQQANQLPNTPSKADVEKLLSGEISKRDRVVLELLYATGVRVEELCGINLDDFREKDVLLVRGKGNKERLVIFGEPAQQAVTEWLPVRAKILSTWGIETDALLIPVGIRHSTRLDVRSVRRIIRAAAKSCNLPAYHPHLLRHACGTHMHDNGASLQAISTLLGHEKLSTTQIYTRVSVSRMKAVYDRAHPHARKEAVCGQ
jgi:integrase/recombinase XerC